MSTSTPPSPATLRRLTGVLFLSQSLFSAAVIAAFTLTPILAADLSGGDGAAGLPNTVTLLGRAAAAYPLGWLMDRAGRRLGLSLGYGLGAAGMVLAAWGVMAGSFAVFLAGMALAGMGRGASEQSRYVAAEVQPPERQARAIGLIVFAGTVGAVGGPLLVEPSGLLAGSLGQNADIGPFLLGALFNLVALLAILGWLRPEPRSIVLAQPGPAAETAGAPVRSLRHIVAEPAVLLAFAAMTIAQLVMTLIMVITPLHMNHLGHTTRLVSLVIMAHTLGMFGLSSATGWLIDHAGRLPVMVAGAGMLIIASLLTPAAPGVPLLALALFLLGLGWNFCFVAGSSLLNEAVAATEKGRVQGAGEVVVAVASGLGSLGTGLVFAGGGILAVGGAGLAFTLLLGVALAWSRRLVRPELVGGVRRQPERY